MCTDHGARVGGQPHVGVCHGLPTGGHGFQSADHVGVEPFPPNVESFWAEDGACCVGVLVGLHFRVWSLNLSKG